MNDEAWREENLAKQAAGVKFQERYGDSWSAPNIFSFTRKKEDYREVPKVKESDVRVPEATREILKGWQKSGLLFCFDGLTAKAYSIPEQPIPEGMSVETVEAMWRQGLLIDFDCNGESSWMRIGEHFNWAGCYCGTGLLSRLRIPAQPIPEKLLEEPQEVSGTEYARAGFEELTNKAMSLSKLLEKSTFNPEQDKEYSERMLKLNHLEKTYSAEKGMAQLNPTIPPHTKERALYWSQRAAGTNEIWQEVHESQVGVLPWEDIPINIQPQWRTWHLYRVKPKTVMYYFALMRYESCKKISAIHFLSIDEARVYAKEYICTIIGDIETREVEV